MGQLAISGMLTAPNTQAYLKTILGEKKEQFVQACISIVSQNKMLQNCEPASVMTAAMSAATLNLSTNPNTGEAYIIPYGNQCQFQLGYLGLIQLALRSGQFLKINVTDVREGEVKFHRLTGDIEWVDVEDRDNKPVIGYCAYMKLTNGFEKYLYMTVEGLKAHGAKYSKSGKLWQTDFEKMAQKTVLKQLLKKYAPKSIDMQKAISYDQAVLKPNYSTNDVDIDYVDSTTSIHGKSEPSDILAESVAEEVEEQPKEEKK